MGLLPELPSGRAGATIIDKIQPSGGWEQAQARGLAHACAVVPAGRGAHWAAVAIASESIRELGKRSASTPRVRMRCKSNLGNHA
eukprot:388686-Pleurochrysis_carterae.AAC.1